MINSIDSIIIDNFLLPCVINTIIPRPIRDLLWGDANFKNGIERAKRSDENLKDGATWLRYAFSQPKPVNTPQPLNTPNSIGSIEKTYATSNYFLGNASAQAKAPVRILLAASGALLFYQHGFTAFSITVGMLAGSLVSLPATALVMGSSLYAQAIINIFNEVALTSFTAFSVSSAMLCGGYLALEGYRFIPIGLAELLMCDQVSEDFNFKYFETAQNPLNNLDGHSHLLSSCQNKVRNAFMNAFSMW